MFRKLKICFLLIFAAVIISGCCPVFNQKEAIKVADTFYYYVKTKQFVKIDSLFAPEIHKIIPSQQFSLIYKVPVQIRGSLIKDSLLSVHKDCNFLILKYKVLYDSIKTNETITIIKTENRKYHIAEYDPNLKENEIF